MTATPILLGQYPLYLAQRSGYYDARHLRLPFADALQGGVMVNGDFKAVPTSPASMAIDIGAAGFLSKAWIAGDAATELGNYRVSYSGKVTADVATNGSGQPRVDSYYLIAEDAQQGGGLANDFIVDVRTGTPTAGAQITAPQTGATYRLGAAAAPTQPYMRLCDVLVASGAGSIVAGNIVDRRPWARGAYAYVGDTSGDFSITATAAGTSAGANRARRRLEIVSGLVEVNVVLKTSNASGSLVSATGVIVNGASTGVLGGDLVPASSTVQSGFPPVPCGALVGSNVFDIYAFVGSGTITGLSNASSPFMVVYREVVGNGDNGTS